ncbi:MAG: hydrogenase [Lentisphaerae bacterium RIFOXYB12_FULL_65_16]|nr:MAG: hydrogenase [Lentisphaerae bacterium RIFOXYA12_64_32]OGV88929.1 MAG: hydrogenase [Lentisphaerae bacterium RIFOXYB12_FULL_65_16]
MTSAPLVHLFLGLLLAPLLLGVINRTKAFFAGRRGPPVLQLYWDLAKLLRKGAVYSQTTTWVFQAGPVVGLAAVLAALALIPFGGAAAPLHFNGDLLLLAYVLGLMRFFTVVAALDTGSSFEGMGASREVQFAALAEPALLLALAAAARKAGSLSLSGILPAAVPLSPELALAAGALVIVFLCENSRVPFDDPNTHLELTMIHEVMVLDHSGPDLALILYSAALKLWVLGALIVGMLVPTVAGVPWVANTVIGLAGMLLLAVVVGVVESVTARVRLVRVPHLLAAAGALAALAFVLVLR